MGFDVFGVWMHREGIPDSVRSPFPARRSYRSGCHPRQAIRDPQGASDETAKFRHERTAAAIKRWRCRPRAMELRPGKILVALLRRLLYLVVRTQVSPARVDTIGIDPD